VHLGAEGLERRPPGVAERDAFALAFVLRAHLGVAGDEDLVEARRGGIERSSASRPADRISTISASP